MENRFWEHNGSIIVATIDGTTTTFNDYVELFCVVPDDADWEMIWLFAPMGKTYAERKEYLREKAIAFQAIDNGGLSWGELYEISTYFAKYGKKYGLLTEFKENGII